MSKPVSKSVRRTILVVPALVALSSSFASAFVNDAGVHAPPSYDTFIPPAAGASYVDPVFGTTIKRVSNAMTMTDNASRGGLTSVATEYSTASPFNRDASRLILQHQSYYALYDGNGTYLRDLPFAVNASTEPRWSRHDASLLYFVSGNRLMSLNVATDATSVLHTFSEYTAISGRGESDISRDGDHFVFAGDNRYVFVYTISTGAKSPVLDTSGHAFNSLYIAPDNSVAVGWIPTGSGRFSGVELFDRNMAFQRQLTRALGHMHLASDTNGDDVLVWTNSDDPTPIASCPNGIVKVRLANAQQTCLLPLPWNLAVHITAPDVNGWAFVETYAPSNPFFASADWGPYTNEILQVKLDGSEVRRLLHHRSRPLNSYAYQPKATVSRDGTRLAFTSNYNLPALMNYPNAYTDAYLAMVSGTSNTPSSPSASNPAPTSAPAPSAPAPAPASTLPTAGARVEQDHAAVIYGGSWSPNERAYHSAGSAKLAMDAGSRADFGFSGTGVSWIGYRDAWSGIANVFVDGVLKGTIDSYSAADTPQAALYSISGLANGSHVLTIQVTGTHNGASAGSWIWVDAFAVAR
jgi:hypothetical protein